LLRFFAFLQKFGVYFQCGKRFGFVSLIIILLAMRSN